MIETNSDSEMNKSNVTIGKSSKTSFVAQI